MSNLYKIGDVSKLCNISIKTLRYYEEMGLIKPVEVDKYTGYRYYNEQNIEKIYQIQFLKDLGLSLKDIREFKDKSFEDELENIRRQIKDLKNKEKLVISLINLKGEKKMKPFINDEQAIGKWKYVGSALSKENFLNGDMVKDNDMLFQEIYFLPEGQGYWVFDRWTKGEMFHFTGVVYTYEIEDEKLYISICNEDGEFQIVCVYEKENSKEYKLEELERKDNINIPFVLDERAVGSWEAVDCIKYADKENYVPRQCERELFVKSLSVMANGDCFQEFNNGNLIKIKWTENYIIRPECSLASHYIIKTINNEQYLIMDWKSGDYVYGGEINCCYVFKKV